MCEFISYAETRHFLADKLKATEESIKLKTTEESIAYEIAAWVWATPLNIVAYQNVEVCGDRNPTYFNDYGREFKNFEYLSKLEVCHFKRAEVETFEPSERYITGLALIERWAGGCGGEDKARAKIKSCCRCREHLTDYFPGYGATQASADESDYDRCPPLDMALFPLSQVKAIEAQGYSIEVIYTNEVKILYEQLKKKPCLTKKECLNLLVKLGESRKTFNDRINDALKYGKLEPGNKPYACRAVKIYHTPKELIKTESFFIWLESNYPEVFHKLKYGNAQVTVPESINEPAISDSTHFYPNDLEAVAKMRSDEARELAEARKLIDRLSKENLQLTIKKNKDEKSNDKRSNTLKNRTKKPKA